MPFFISATFRFGYYQGHDISGRVEEYPNVVRLQCAFASAAYSLSAYEGNDVKEEEFNNKQNLPIGLNLSKDLENAVLWFEDNPPDAIEFPKTEMPKDFPKAYRLSGNWKSNGGTDLPTSGNGKLKKEKDAAPHVCLDGPMVWWWKNAPSGEIFGVLKKLAAEIPYLGEACSPVKILVSVADEIPSCAYRQCCADGKFMRMGIQNYRVPLEGNAELLQDIWKKKHDECEGRIEKKPVSDDKEVSAWTRDRRYTTCYDYRLIAKDNETNLPWNRGLLLEAVPCNEKSVWRPEQNQWKDWACAIHRALVKRVAPSPTDYLPEFFSGEGGNANNMSIQILSHDYDDCLAYELPNSNHAVLLMFPSSASEEDVSTLQERLKNPLYVYLGKLGKIKLKKCRDVNLKKLWSAPKDKVKRYWQPMPLYVADNRPIQCKEAPRPWTIAESMKVSLGYIYRDILDLNLRNNKEHGDKGRLAFLNKINEDKVKIKAGYSLAVSHPKNYVHHMKKGAHFIAGTALIDLGKLAGGCETLALAIGQSRHFSGGFLIPVDIVPESN